MIKLAHFYWGNTQLPWLHSLCLRSFAKHHPGWTIRLWMPQTVEDRCHYDSHTDCWDDLPEQVRPAFVSSVEDITGARLTDHNPRNSWTQTARSDALRLHLLREYGGMWSDCDVLYFRSVEDSSLDDKGTDTFRMYWGDGVYQSLMYAPKGHEAISRLCDRQRMISPASQPPGGQSPFGAQLFIDEYGNPGNIPGFNQLHPGEFHCAPYAVAMHYRAARVMWGSTSRENWMQKCADVPGLVQAISRVLEVI